MPGQSASFWALKRMMTNAQFAALNCHQDLSKTTLTTKTQADSLEAQVNGPLTLMGTAEALQVEMTQQNNALSALAQRRLDNTIFLDAKTRCTMKL